MLLKEFFIDIIHVETSLCDVCIAGFEYKHAKGMSLHQVRIRVGAFLLLPQTG